MHPVGRAILEKWNVLPSDQVERYALASTPLELAVRTAPDLIDDPAAQDAALAELAAAEPTDPTAWRREDRPHPTPAPAQLGGNRTPARWPETVRTYERFELEAYGPIEGNPYTDVEFTAVIEGPAGHIHVPGFYDGDGIYRLRFMPLESGSYTFSTSSNSQTLDGHTGKFAATPQTQEATGPSGRRASTSATTMAPPTVPSEQLPMPGCTNARNEGSGPWNRYAIPDSTSCVCASFPNGSPTTRRNLSSRPS